MYLPAHFAERRPEVLLALLRAQPLATVVSQSPRGAEVDLLPLLWRPGEPGDSTVTESTDATAPFDTAAPRLVGHVARANPLWQVHPATATVVALFCGPQGYVSPSAYPGKTTHGKVVPTWNYLAVEVRGRLRIHDDAPWKQALLAALSQTHEAAQAVPWRIHDAPADYIARQLDGVVGIEIVIEHMVGKWKLSQNQPPANQQGVVRALEARATADARALAQAMREHLPAAPDAPAHPAAATPAKDRP